MMTSFKWLPYEKIVSESGTITLTDRLQFDDIKRLFEFDFDYWPGQGLFLHLKDHPKIGTIYLKHEGPLLILHHRDGTCTHHNVKSMTENANFRTPNIRMNVFRAIGKSGNSFELRLDKYLHHDIDGCGAVLTTVVNKVHRTLYGRVRDLYYSNDANITIGCAKFRVTINYTHTSGCEKSPHNGCSQMCVITDNFIDTAKIVVIGDTVKC